MWLALASQEELEASESNGTCKGGSGVRRGGKERVRMTEVDGWGVRGRVEPLDQKTLRGRRKGVRDLTEEEREGFEMLGRDCWEQMEALRGEWERRMGW